MGSTEHVIVREHGEEIWRGPGELFVERVGRGRSWRVELSVPPEVGLRFQAARDVEVDLSPAETATATVQAVDVRGAAGGALTRVILKGKGPRRQR